MKLVIDERVKHRLIGLAVILSIAAIFAPAIMKKSSQRLDGNVSVSVELPPKPAHPDVALSEKKAIFEQVKLAQVELPDVSPEQEFTTVAKAEPLSERSDREDSIASIGNAVVAEEAPATPKAVIHKVSQGVQFPTVSKPTLVAKNSPVSKPVKTIAKPAAAKPTAQKLSLNSQKAGYAIQLAMFSRQNNAELFIAKLKHQGYPASYTKVKTTEGMMFRVLVGSVEKKEEALVLQKKLASALQIQGLIISTEQG